jgi:hypothetical protein
MNYEDFDNDFFEDQEDEMVQLKKQSEMQEQAAKVRAQQVEENYTLISRNGVNWSQIPVEEKTKIKKTLEVMIDWFIANDEQYEKCAVLKNILDEDK